MVNLPKVLGVSGGVVVALGAIMGFYGFPTLIKSQISSMLALKPGSDIRKMWEQFPEPIEFQVYLFNYTNPLEIQKGAKPVVEEIGPFFYDEYKSKHELKDREKDDTVLFKPKMMWHFNKEKSSPLTGDELVTIPHVAILAMVLTVEKEKPGMLSLVNKAIKALYRNPESVFMTAPARDLLFDGVVINCTLTDFAGKAICTQLKANAKDMERVSEDIFKFSFFGMQNGSLSSQFRVKRGIKNIADIGRVVEFNGQKKLSSWSGEKCNEISGTDGTIFPPFLTSEDKILAFSPELCRTIAAVFERPTTYKGIQGYRYTASLGDMSSNPNEKCFCPTEDTCLKKGSFELSRCAGAPLVVTLPHMYETDEEYLRSVIGQHPEQRKHEIFMEFEPMTGTPLGVRRRLQFNIFLHKVDKIDLMKEVPSALLPIFWINEGLDLGDKFVNDLNANLFRTLNILSGVQWTMMGGGLALAAGAALLHYKKRSGFATVSNPLALAAKSNGIPSVDGSLRY